jgi:hypothetical protein
MCVSLHATGTTYIASVLLVYLWFQYTGAVAYMEETRLSVALHNGGCLEAHFTTSAFTST